MEVSITCRGHMDPMWKSKCKQIQLENQTLMIELINFTIL